MNLRTSERDVELSTEELTRYSRHVVLPQVGVAGQARLKRARVLIVGAGGLGCPAALYLAAAGIGHIGIADHDTVSASNLQRQVLYRDVHVGRPKAVVAAEVLREVNPHVAVTAHETRIDATNAESLVARYDMVLDGCDSVPTRYVLNAATVAAGKPYIYGSVYQYEGQVSVFGLPGGPCFACLFPNASPNGCTCSLGGVLGVVPGIIGIHQAAEVVKLALGAHDVLNGRLLVCDLLGLRFDTLTIPRDPHCACCRGRATVPAQTAAAVREPDGPAALRPEELSQLLANATRLHLLDVRAHSEMLLDPLPGAIHIPWPELPARLDEVPREAGVIVYCRRGVRSAGAALFLRHAGFQEVRHLEGGLHAWMQFTCGAAARSA